MVNIDSLIDLRQFARTNGNYELSDKIRDKLITHSVFIIDTKEGQEVHHELKGTTKQQFDNKIKRDIRANNNFDAWLFTQKQKIK